MLPKTLKEQMENGAAPEETQGQIPDCLCSQHSDQLINKEPHFSVLQFKDTLFNKYC